MAYKTWQLIYSYLSGKVPVEKLCSLCPVYVLFKCLFINNNKNKQFYIESPMLLTRYIRGKSNNLVSYRKYKAVSTVVENLRESCSRNEIFQYRIFWMFAICKIKIHLHRMFRSYLQSTFEIITVPSLRNSK